MRNIYINFNDLKQEVQEEIIEIALEESLKEYAKDLGIEDLLEYDENENLLYYESLETIINYLYSLNLKNKTDAIFTYFENNSKEEIKDEIENYLRERAEIILNKLNYIFNI